MRFIRSEADRWPDVWSLLPSPTESYSTVRTWTCQFKRTTLVGFVRVFLLCGGGGGGGGVRPALKSDGVAEKLNETGMA